MKEHQSPKPPHISVRTRPNSKQASPPPTLKSASCIFRGEIYRNLPCSNPRFTPSTRIRAPLTSASDMMNFGTSYIFTSYPSSDGLFSLLVQKKSSNHLWYLHTYVSFPPKSPSKGKQSHPLYIQTSPFPLRRPNGTEWQQPRRLSPPMCPSSL